MKGGCELRAKSHSSRLHETVGPVQNHSFFNCFFSIFFWLPMATPACQMPPRWFPDASQTPPRCLPDASQMPLVYIYIYILSYEFVKELISEAINPSVSVTTFQAFVDRLRTYRLSNLSHIYSYLGSWSSLHAEPN